MASSYQHLGQSPTPIDTLHHHERHQNQEGHQKSFVTIKNNGRALFGNPNSSRIYPNSHFSQKQTFTILSSCTSRITHTILPSALLLIAPKFHQQQQVPSSEYEAPFSSPLTNQQSSIPASTTTKGD